MRFIEEGDIYIWKDLKDKKVELTLVSSKRKWVPLRLWHFFYDIWIIGSTISEKLPGNNKTVITVN
jgi:hypothetical protein